MEGSEVSTETLEVFLELSYTFLLELMDQDGGARGCISLLEEQKWSLGTYGVLGRGGI